MSYSETINRNPAIVPHQKNPYFTVILFDYIRHQYTERAIRSVMNQSIPDDYYEIIILTDNSSLQLSQFPLFSSITVWYTGLVRFGEALELGIKKSKGKIICTLDNDDEWVSSKLQELFKYFRMHEDLAMIKNEVRMLSNNGGGNLNIRAFIKMNIPITATNKFYVLNDSPPRKILGRSLTHNNSSMAFTRGALLSKLNILNDIENLQDITLFLSASLSTGKVGFLDKALTLYYVERNRRLKDSQSYLDFVKGPNGKTKYGESYKKFYETFIEEISNTNKSFVKRIFLNFGVMSKIYINLRSEDKFHIEKKEMGMFLFNSIRTFSLNHLFLLCFYYINLLFRKKLNKFMGW